MANPTSRHTRSRRDMRRATWMKTTAPNLNLCPECQEPKLPHRICMSCGTYNKKKILEVVDKDSL
ncbi:MAG: 50S ribosomal protein L32 [Nitrospira sp.]|nr:50S ribosomal protein L32 [bacterium]MBL7049928.1 50S ribosomal protein L32 [Nitrospira sp.]